MCRLFTTLFALVIFAAAYSQEALTYNLNKYNGLSTNHVYTVHVDHLGYLWIGSPKGVFRYNGYTLKKYDYTNGLATIDIWSFLEDKDHKLWLLGISNGLGYIQNSHFKRIYVSPATGISEIYPRSPKEYSDRIVFTQQHNSTYSFITNIANDSLSLLKVRNYKLSDYTPISIFTSKAFVEIYLDSIYLFNPETVLNTRDLPEAYKAYPIISQRMSDMLFSSRIRGMFADKYYFFCNDRDSILEFYNVLNNSNFVFSLDDNKEYIVHAFPTKNSFYLISNKKIYSFDNRLNVTGTYTSYLFPGAPTDSLAVTYYRHNSFWGKGILATQEHGLYINYGSNTHIKKHPLALNDFVLLNGADSISAYWWNYETKTLIEVKDGAIVNKHYLPLVTDILKATKIAENRAFISTQNQAYWMDTKSGLLTKIIEKAARPDSAFGLSKTSKELPFYVRDIAFADSNLGYYSSSFGGLLSIRFIKNTGITDSVYFDRYHNIRYNKKHNQIIAFSDDKVIFKNTVNGRLIKLSGSKLDSLDIHGIENIMMDDYGNVYIKEYSTLLRYDISTGKTERLLSNYILTDAKVELYGNTLYVAALFGVIKVEIADNNQLKVKSLYPNTKNLLYAHIKYAQFSANSTLLCTDKGAYFIDMSGLGSAKLPSESFRIVATVDSTQQLVTDGDTLKTSLSSNVIDVDIIKPTGTGELFIEYAINNGAYVSTASQVILPKLTPGEYYTVQLKAYDNNWESRVITFAVYAEPVWWQTPAMKRWLITGVVLLTIGLGYLIFRITKYTVNKNNERKNQRRELELKSIYSQINPHFIFNSLSTAQYFVKKNRTKEAAEHISQFSNLLRSYIKSSRNKYISIAEEIENLENYLQLQQARFENKFDYHFNIAEGVSIRATKIPSLILQPFVENALNHGIFHMQGKGTINISFLLDAHRKELVCVVDDNGIGRKKSAELKNVLMSKADSYGSILINELVNTFNKYEKIKIAVEYIDKLEPDSGTTVLIRIKNYENV